MAERKEEKKRKEQYKLVRNIYVRIRREEEKRYERDLVDKCKEEPKPFYGFINVKIRHEESVARWKENKGVLCVRNRRK